MRTLLVVLAVVALLVGVAAEAASAGTKTEIEKFIKRIEKFAGDDYWSQKPRGLCVCQDEGPNHTRAGVLTYFGELGDSFVEVRCCVRGFAGDGTHTTVLPCDTFEILSK